MKTITYQSLGRSIAVRIPEQYSSIGFCMSGGVDSTLLAALVFPHLDLTKVTVLTVDKGTSTEYVAGILKQMGVEVKHKTLPVVERPNGNISPDLMALTDRYDFVYTGSTANPPWANAIPDGQKPNRYVAVSWQNMMFPFGMTDKSVVVDVMRQTNNLNLLPYTHTCTERPHTNCGVCFACRERKWAFEVAKVLDVIEYEE